MKSKRNSKLNSICFNSLTCLDDFKQSNKGYLTSFQSIKYAQYQNSTSPLNHVLTEIRIHSLSTR